MKIKLNANSVHTDPVKAVAQRRLRNAHNRLTSKYRTREQRRAIQAEIRLMRVVLAA